MEQNDYCNILCDKISELRRQSGLTQEQFANKLGITYQAISKWENYLSCPDISLLPKIADIFNISIDKLFNRQSEFNKPQKFDTNLNLPWSDDNTLRAVLFKGHSLISYYNQNKTHNSTKFVFRYEGEALDIESYFSIECEGNISGNVKAGTHINCNTINGNNVNQQVHVVAGTSIECSSINGNVNAGTRVNCKDINGNAKAGTSIQCESIKGDAKAGTRIQYIK